MNISGITFSIFLLCILIFLAHAHVKPTYNVSLYVFMKRYGIIVCSSIIKDITLLYYSTKKYLFNK